MSKIKNIYFTSTVRAGAGLLGRILNASDQISLSHAILNFCRFYLNKYEPLSKNLNKLLDEAYYRLKFRFNVIIDKKKISQNLKTQKLNHSTLYKEILISIFEKQISKKTIYVGDKEANAWEYFDQILKIDKSCKVIILVRDPRDVLCSFKKITISKKNDYLITIFNFFGIVNTYKILKKKYTKRVKLIKFNELKIKPEKTIKSLCKFLNVKYKKNFFNEKKHLDVNGKIWDSKYSYSFKGKLKYKALNRWKDIIDDEDLYLCEMICHKEIKFLGLELENKNLNKKLRKKAIKKLISSKLLRESYYNWKAKKIGNQLYPLNPTNPKYWDKTTIYKKNKFIGKN